MMNPRLLDAVFVVLVLATALTWGIGEAGESLGLAGPLAAACILAAAQLKGWLVIREFMGLRHAALPWRLATVGWLALVLAVIAATYWKGL